MIYCFHHKKPYLNTVALIISSSKESGYNAQYTTSTSSTSVSFLRSLQPSIFSIFSWFLFPALVLFVSTNPRQYSPSGNPFSFKCSGLKLYFSCASFVSFTYEPPIIVYCSSFHLNHSLKLLIPVTIYIFPHNFSNISSTAASTRSSASSLNDNARESSSTLSSFDNKCGLYLHISTAI